MMLLTMTVENFKSFSTLSQLNMIAKPSEKSIPGAAIPVPLKGTGADGVLAAGAIYGPNASGKTNFLMAAVALKDAVTGSHTDWAPEQPIPIEPHVCARDKEVTLECEFIQEGIRYRYGFSCQREFFTREWLYSYPTGRERQLFDRRTSKTEAGYETVVEYGPHLVGAKRDHDSIARRTRPNSLFISAATQDNQEDCSLIYSFFNDRVRYIRADNSSAAMAVTSMLTHSIDDFKNLLLPLMKLADSSIIDITTEKTDDSEDSIEDILDDEKFHRHVQKYKAAFRIGDKIDSFPISFEGESRGVKRLFSIAFYVITALGSGMTLLVDELEPSMHAHVAAQLLALFQNPSSNPLGAQLIFTTHETRLLSLEHMRRDQIWFCEREGVHSELYSLLEFSPRKDENFESGYLRGRYGAIPKASISPEWIEQINKFSEKFGKNYGQ